MSPFPLSVTKSIFASVPHPSKLNNLPPRSSGPRFQGMIKPDFGAFPPGFESVYDDFEQCMFNAQYINGSVLEPKAPEMLGFGQWYAGMDGNQAFFEIWHFSKESKERIHRYLVDKQVIQMVNDEPFFRTIPIRFRQVRPGFYD